MSNREDSYNEAIEMESGALIDYLYNNYHMKTREFMSEIIERLKNLEIKEETVNTIQQIMVNFEGEMESHLQKEEQILFPLIKNYETTKNPQYKIMVGCPIERMEMEHEDHLLNIEKIKNETQSFSKDIEKIEELKNIYPILDKLYILTHEHIDLENRILFHRMK